MYETTIEWVCDTCRSLVMNTAAMREHLVVVHGIDPGICPLQKSPPEFMDGGGWSTERTKLTADLASGPVKITRTRTTRKGGSR